MTRGACSLARQLGCALALIAAIAAPAGAAPDPQAWPQYGYDAGNTWFNQAENQISPANVHTLKLRKINTGLTSLSALYGTVYRNGKAAMCASREGSIVAIQPRKGLVLTNSFDLGPSGCTGIALYQDSAITTSGGWNNGRLSAHDQHGTQRWTKQVESAYTHPVVAQGRVFVSTLDGLVFAYEPVTGKRIWKTRTVDYGRDGKRNSAVSVAEGKVVLTEVDGATKDRVFALNASDGTTAWTVATTSDFDFSAPMLYRGKAILLDVFGTVRALDLHTGAQQWETPLFSEHETYLAAAGDLVVASTAWRTIVGLDLATGAVRWTMALNPNEVHHGNIAVANGVLYFVARADVWAFDQYLVAADVATGQILQRFPVVLTGDRLDLIVADGLVLIPSDREGDVFVYGLPE